MRILYHHRTRGQHVEGVHIRGIVNAFRDLGHEVHVLSFPGSNPEREAQPQAAAGRGRLGALVVRVPGVAFEFLELAYNLLTLVRVPAALRRHPAQMIYERYSLFLAATVWQARRRGIPIVLEINDSALVERVRPLWMKGLARRIEAWCFRSCNGLVFVSTRFQQLAQAAYGTLAASVVSPNAGDPVQFDPARFDIASLRDQRGLAGHPVCGYVGAFAHWHGVAEFVRRIVARMAEQPQLILLLVGDGRDFPLVRRLIAERGLEQRVVLPGRVAHEKIAEWIVCMDYAILPDSNEYGSPMKLFEFMAMGVGVVAPDYDPVAEVIADGETGWLFPRRDIDACVDRVLALGERPEECARVGAAAREYIARERRWRNNAEQALALLPAGVQRR